MSFRKKFKSVKTEAASRGNAASGVSNADQLKQIFVENYKDFRDDFEKFDGSK